MNFLEQLTAEWYEYQGYFCRTNITFGKLARGGHMGEMDVVAYNPKTKEFIHIECSTDAWPWEKKKETFLRKFGDAEKYYNKKFLFEKSNIKKLAITGFSTPKLKRKMDFGSNIEVKLIPEFIASIASELSIMDPWSKAIPESYPLLRSIQYGTFYLMRKIRREAKGKK